MRCYRCASEIALARKVQLRAWRDAVATAGGPESAAYLSYQEDRTFRWAFLCLDCYRQLDNEFGVGDIGGRLFNLAGSSRGDRAVVVNEAKYQAFQRRQAAAMGLAIEPTREERHGHA